MHEDVLDGVVELVAGAVSIVDDAANAVTREAVDKGPECAAVLRRQVRALLDRQRGPNWNRPRTLLEPRQPYVLGPEHVRVEVERTLRNAGLTKRREHPLVGPCHVIDEGVEMVHEPTLRAVWAPALSARR